MLLSAALLFAVQPMVAKMLLPSLGGSSAVWTTCMLFFQALLLAGYAYAHAGARLVSARVQAISHIVLMFLAVVVLPLGIGSTPPESDVSPLGWLLLELTVNVGLPFFVLSATAPILQHWLAQTDHPHAGDPYHLYAASNVGSMAALLGYPFVIEPLAGIAAQTLFWSAGFGAMILATGACVFLLFKRAQPGSAPNPDKGTTPALRPTWRLRGHWVLMAFVPSSLMLGVTQYLTTDIAAVPLLWVVPLALYLLTFIIVFARSIPRIELPAMALPWLVVALALLNLPLWAIVATHLLLFFALAMTFHRRLADARPHPEHLTEFYLLMSTGGALGGLFNALIAPIVFDRLVEYFVILALAVALLPVADEALGDTVDPLKPRVGRFIAPVGIVVVGGVFLGYAVQFIDFDYALRAAIGLGVIAMAATLSYLFPKMSNGLLAVIFCLGIAHEFTTIGTLEYERSFYAAYKVFDRTSQGIESRRISHGTTSHGAQILEDGHEDIPVAYYHPSGPIGQLFDTFEPTRVAVVGLGAGAMAAYAQNDEQRFDFFEIDPVVEDLARRWFTYLERCGDACSVVIGDGRHKLAARPDQYYDLIVLDAYNSDAIPTHLLTREALELYVEKLKPGGLIALHVSNRYLDIHHIAAALALDADLEYRTRLHIPDSADERYYVLASRYMVLAREEDHLGELIDDERWELSPAADIVWTDDFSNILHVLDWN